MKRITILLMIIALAVTMNSCTSFEEPVTEFGLTVSEQLELARESEAVTTEADTTEAVTTEAVTTEAETTEAVTTEAVTTEAEITEAVITEADTTEAETTEAVTTEAVTTEADTTEAVMTPIITSVQTETYVEPANELTYVLNSNRKKIHYPDCSSVKDIKPENHVDFYGTLEEAEAMGYSPCGRCKP